MLELTDKIKSALGITPIRSLSDSALRRELSELSALRNGLLPRTASPSPAPAVIEPRPAAAPSAYVRIPLWKGSIFSHRVPVEKKTEQVYRVEVLSQVPSKTDTAAGREEALERTAKTAGVTRELYAAFSLRLKLLEAETAARGRREGRRVSNHRGEGRKKHTGGAWVHPSLRRAGPKDESALARALPDEEGHWVRLSPDTENHDREANKG